MPVVTRCPSCNRSLRVPDNLIGSKVRCPQCKNVFTAEAGGESADVPAPLPAAKAPPAPRPVSPISDRPSRPPQRPPASEPEPDDEPRFEEAPDDEPEGDELPRRRRGGARRERAAQMVAGPGIGLMVIGILGIVLGLGFAALLVVLGGLVAMQPAGPRGAAAGPVPAEFAGNIASCLGSVCIGAVLTFGGIQMKNLRSKSWARAASIIAMVPCLTCCLWGLPIGIWATVVLNKPEVAGAFES